jgi:hypothetical protein
MMGAAGLAVVAVVGAWFVRQWGGFRSASQLYSKKGSARWGK